MNGNELIKTEEQSTTKLSSAVIKTNISSSTSSTSTSTSSSSISLAMGLGVAGLVMALHLPTLMSLPIVLSGKGAPYLPIKKKNLHRIFNDVLPKIIYNHHHRNNNNYYSINNNKKVYKTLIDLGSGDGRICFNAASKSIISQLQTQLQLKEQKLESLRSDQNDIIMNSRQQRSLSSLRNRPTINNNNDNNNNNNNNHEKLNFSHIEGYEINPVLYLYCQMKNIIWKAYNYSIQKENIMNNITNTKITFYCKNFWLQNFSHADIICIYGLGPIMNDLSLKLSKELQPGTIVVSNVFTLPLNDHFELITKEDNIHFYYKK